MRAARGNRKVPLGALSDCRQRFAQRKTFDLQTAFLVVWRFPLPHAKTASETVHVKLGDYGISRFTYGIDVCKGFGGSEVSLPSPAGGGRNAVFLALDGARNLSAR